VMLRFMVQAFQDPPLCSSTEITFGRKNFSGDCSADPSWRLKKDLHLPIFFNEYKRDKNLNTRAKKSEGPEEHSFINY
jgi:hypothetical protein